ncbi:DUF6461 domain-containing protein [Actinoplanes sp. NPDC051851]|uniref:DUF6461 domain-containing protein n=1 Tax=Actinoplanes sp. NPDC051851 TaxID=3154753 RepID=UPI003414C12B
MKRRVVLLGVLLASLAGCGEAQAVEPEPSGAEGAAHVWAAQDGQLGRGFCLTLVKGRTPAEVTERLGATGDERVLWAQIVGPGDGERDGTGRFFAGLANLGTWTLIVEDAGGLGMAGNLVAPLSAETEVVAYRCDADRRGQLRVYRDGELELDFDSAYPEKWGGSRPGDYVTAMSEAGLIGGTNVMDPTEAALTFVEGRIGLSLSGALLAERTYLLVTVPNA